MEIEMGVLDPKVRKQQIADTIVCKTQGSKQYNVAAAKLNKDALNEIISTPKQKHHAPNKISKTKTIFSGNHPRETRQILENPEQRK